MRGRAWFWAAIAADAVLLTFAFYMAISAAMIVNESGGGVFPVAVAVLFLALPVLCILSPLSAWRALQRRRRPAQIAVLLVAPWTYAAFLVVFLIYS